MTIGQLTTRKALDPKNPKLYPAHDYWICKSNFPQLNLSALKLVSFCHLYQPLELVRNLFLWAFSFNWRQRAFCTLQNCLRHIKPSAVVMKFVSSLWKVSDWKLTKSAAIFSQKRENANKKKIFPTWEPISKKVNNYFCWYDFFLILRRKVNQIRASFARRLSGESCDRYNGIQEHIFGFCVILHSYIGCTYKNYILVQWYLLASNLLTIPHQCKFGPRHHHSVLNEAYCIVLPLQCSWQYIFYRLEVPQVNRSRCFVHNLHCTLLALLYCAASCQGVYKAGDGACNIAVSQ